MYYSLSYNFFHFMLLITKIRVLFFIVLVYFSTYSLIASSNTAYVPVNITVEGKLIITDAEDESIVKGAAPSLNTVLRLQKKGNKNLVANKKAIRIRTNLNNWKLTAQRVDLPLYRSRKINPKYVSLLLSTQSGSKANPKAGKLASPFNTASNLSKISSNLPTDVIIGQSKTSKDRDPTNKNNWFQVTSTYSILPKYFTHKNKINDWNAIISYNLVSP